MHAFLAHYGYGALFLLSFLAATLIPLGSEWLLVTMLLQHHDPLVTVGVATIGNYLGACTTYAIGLWGGPFLVRSVLRIDDAARERAEHCYNRYGSWSLLLSWLPLVGDPLCLVGGVLRTGFARFSLLVFGGKLGRYAAIAWVTLAGARLAAG
jgi:membrane protein YqaA with SNARE-associated domain